jgi:hypothetical protein
MHFFESLLEALAAYVIHREKGKCLGPWHNIRARCRNTTYAFTFPKIVAKIISPSVPSGIGPFTSRADPPVNESRCTTPTIFGNPL